MAARRVDPPAITRVVGQLTPLLRGHGFAPLSDRSTWSGKFNIYTWIRKRWKEDAIRLGWRKPPLGSYFLDVHWSVPRPHGEPIIVSGMNAGYARRRRATGRLPTTLPLVGPRAERKWCEEVVSDAEFAVAWCDRCATLEGALAALSDPDRNGPRTGSNAYVDAEQYIRAHAPSG